MDQLTKAKDLVSSSAPMPILAQSHALIDIAESLRKIVVYFELKHDREKDRQIGPIE